MPQPEHKRLAAKQAKASKRSGKAPARTMTIELKPEHAHMAPYEILAAWLKQNRGWGLHVAEQTGGDAGRMLRCASLGSPLSQAVQVTGLSETHVNAMAKEIVTGAIEAEVRQGKA